MPNKHAEGQIQGKIWVHRGLWHAAAAKAGKEGRSLAEVIREFLRAYVKE